VIAFSITTHWVKTRRKLYLKLFGVHALAKQLHEICLKPFDEEYKSQTKKAGKEYAVQMNKLEITYQNKLSLLEKDFKAKLNILVMS
jgi:hypothetical protein